MLSVTWTRGLLRRRRSRLVGTTVGVGVAVALLASIGTFLSASKATMATRASRSVSVAWQVEVQAGGDPTTVQQAVASFPGVTTALPVLFARTTAFAATIDGTTQTTGGGYVVGLPASYSTSFADQIRGLVGATEGILLSQQTATNLHAGPGDTMTISAAGQPDATVTVAGVVELTNADSLFQKVGAPANSQPKAPPDNVLIMPDTTWHQLFDPLATSRPELVTTQIHTDYTRPLPPDPSAAYRKVLGEGHNVELKLTGAGLVGNNLAAKLASARSDSLYAQILFLFLGLPGTVLAGLLTTAVAAAGADRRRRDQALLRTRGASTRQLVRLALAETALVSIVGGIVGLLGALLIGRLAFGATNFGGTTWTAAVWITASCAVGTAIALTSIALPAWRDARQLTVTASRAIVGRAKNPRWQRYGFDAVALVASLIVFWLTSRNGYKLVLAVEGVPTISVNYWAFAGPALLWVAAGLFTWRVADVMLDRGRPLVTRIVRPLSGGLSDTVAASMRRQRRMLARGLTIVALSTAFAASTAVFNATYRQQAEVDAVLSNGADVTVVEPPGVTVRPDQAASLSALPGVKGVTALQHRFAYVGNDLQDLYGIDPTTIVRATKLQDAYFDGGTAKQLMARLAAKPDAALVSAETARDFQLALGDTLHLRLQDGRTKQLTDVSFTYAGVVKKFPSAPSDSFLVANATYVATQTGSDTVGLFLIDTNHVDTTAVAAQVQAAVGTSAKVNDIANKRRKIGSSLTSVELAGLTRVELGFALLLAAAASGLVLWLGLNERRRTFAIAYALGANRRQLAGFVSSEATFVTMGGLALGSVSGWALTRMIVKVLNGVFDPPPTMLAIPWSYLGFVVAAAMTAAFLAASRATSTASQPAIELLRDL
jgi:putative ABC transport system permease protein